MKQAQPAAVDWRALRTYDRHGMLDLVGSFPAQCRQALAMGQQVEVPPGLAGFERILCLGMGGSGIAADLLASLVDIPVTTWKGYDIPHWIGQETLLVAITYSGNTEETLSSFSEGLRVTSRALGISSGGRLAALCSERGLLWIKLPGGFQPRAALGHLALSALPVLAELGVRAADVRAALRCLGEMAVEFDQDSTCNCAQDMAVALRGKVPLIYGVQGHTGIAAARWKTQVNENAKQPAFWAEVPELCHNEVVTYESLKSHMPQATPIFLRSSCDHPRATKRVEILMGLLSRWGIPFLEAHARGDDAPSQLLSLIYLGDWVSVYLALLNAVDPTPVHPIEELKSALSRP